MEVVDNNAQIVNHENKAEMLKQSSNVLTKMDMSESLENKENLTGQKTFCKKHEEYQYLEKISEVIKQGNTRIDRTNIGTKSIFGTQARYSLRNNTLPLLTTKKVFTRGIIEELLWFIKGSTNAKELQAKNIKIWDGNSSREFLDKYGFTDREEGDLGPIYGFQWRHYGAEYKDMHTDYTGQGLDQLKEVIWKIKNTPNDRRIIMTAWNPIDVPKMALPPCHCFVQFFVSDGELSCQLYQRSADMGLGVPFNIASYAILTHMIAHVCNLKAGDFVHTIGDCHVYLNHITALEQQLTREPRPFPTLKINNPTDDIENFKYSDFEIIGYDPHPVVKMEMAV